MIRIFLALAFALSWPPLLYGFGWFGAGEDVLKRYVFSCLGMLMVALSAFLTRAFFERRGFRDAGWRLGRFKWYVAALLFCGLLWLGPPLAALSFGELEWNHALALSFIFGAVWLRTGSIFLVSVFHGYWIGIRDATAHLFSYPPAFGLITLVVVLAAWFRAVQWLNRYQRGASPDLPNAERENRLRAWFTRDCDPVRKVVDGLDIGWGGVQRWATARMLPLKDGPHLDFACGYATFLAQLGWRFPGARLVGLNIDYCGPHAQARELLHQAGVRAQLAQADARRMPFRDGVFGSASCFLGLQDIEIGFGEGGVRAAVAEAVRVLRPDGVLSLLDEFTFERFEALLQGLPVTVIDCASRELDTHWNRDVAERAIALYTDGWAAQARPPSPAARERVREEAQRRMAEELERQLGERGTYVPFGPVQMVVVRKDIENRHE